MNMKALSIIIAVTLVISAIYFSPVIFFVGQISISDEIAASDGNNILADDYYKEMQLESIYAKIINELTNRADSAATSIQNHFLILTSMVFASRL